MTKLEIRYVSPDELRPYAGNARTHSKKQVGQIADSIERFGFANPIIVSGDHEVIAGHGRLAAAKLLGHPSVPIVVLADMTEADRRAYVMADNRLAELAGWDRDTLAIELQFLQDAKTQGITRMLESAFFSVCKPIVAGSARYSSRSVILIVSRLRTLR